MRQSDQSPSEAQPYSESALRELARELVSILEENRLPTRGRVLLVGPAMACLQPALESHGFEAAVPPARESQPEASVDEREHPPVLLESIQTLAREFPLGSIDLVIAGDAFAEAGTASAENWATLLVDVIGSPVLGLHRNPSGPLANLSPPADARAWPAESIESALSSLAGETRLPLMPESQGFCGRQVTLEWLRNLDGNPIDAATLEALLDNPNTAPHLLAFSFQVYPANPSPDPHFGEEARTVSAELELMDTFDAYLDTFREMDGRVATLALAVFDQERDLLQRADRIGKLSNNLDEWTSYARDLRLELQGMHSSLSWRITEPIREARAKNWRYFLVDLPKRLWRQFKPSALFVRAHLWRILKRNQDHPVVLFRPFLAWNIPLFQRPQHIAKGLGAAGIIYFYGTKEPALDYNVNGFKPVAPGCWVTNRFDLVEKIRRQRVVHLYSTDWNCHTGVVMTAQKRGDIVCYEYIDELHDDLSIPLVREVYQRHKYILEHSDIVIIVSADRLHQEVMQARPDGKNVHLITNGVEYDHFAVRRDPGDIPEELRPIVERGQPVIGYHGALAKWFDYQLVKRLARERPEYRILLIGWEYDGSMKQAELEECENIHVMGPIEYSALPRYSVWFDVATIPFQVYDLTHSTSPIKLFEYMALGHPIVTTDMQECRKYESVLTATSHAHFIERVDEALGLRENAEYGAILEREALANTWEAKSRQIADAIRQALAERAERQVS